MLNKKTLVLLAVLGAVQIAFGMEAELNISLMRVARGDKKGEISKLIDEGADPNFCNNGGWTPLVNACWSRNLSVIELLLKKGAKVNLRGQRGWTALHYAAYHGYSDQIELLLRLGASKYIKDCTGKTPYELAAMQNHEEAKKLLFQVLIFGHIPYDGKAIQ